MVFRLREQVAFGVDEKSPVLGERRLLVGILHRALIDLFEMKDRHERLREVRSRVYGALSDDRVAQSCRTGKSSCEGCHQSARALLRWFLSKDEEDFSFLFIVQTLGMNDLKDKILFLIESPEVPDRSFIKRIIYNRVI